MDSVLIPDHLIPFSFSSWYPRFAHCALKGVVIPLPPEFLAWLSEDGLLMPLECDDGEDSVEWSDEEIGEGGDGDGDGDKAEQDEGKSISTLIYFTGLVLLAHHYHIPPPHRPCSSIFSIPLLSHTPQPPLRTKDEFLCAGRCCLGKRQ